MLSRVTITLWVAVLGTVGLYAAAFSAEAPVGSLSGRIVAADTGAPLPGLSLTVRPHEPVSGADSHYLQTDDRGEFVLRRLPVGNYEIEAHAEVHQSEPVPVTVREGEAVSTRIELVPGEPFLNLNVHEHSRLPGEKAKVAVHGFRQGRELLFTLFHVSPEALTGNVGERLRKLLKPVSIPSDSDLDRQGDSDLRKVAEWRHAVRRLNAEGVFYENETFDLPAQGLYLVRVTGAGEARSRQLGWIMSTDLAVVTKSVHGRVVAFATHLLTGAPRSGVRIRLMREGSSSRSATTGANGTAVLQLPEQKDDSEYSLVASGDGSLCFMQFNPYGWYGRHKSRAHLYTDRPVYRPGDRVNFKGIVRRLEGTRYSLPPRSTVTVTVEDMAGAAIFETSTTLDEHGTLSGTFTLPPDAVGGAYVLTAALGETERHTAYFGVASYRKPEYEVSISTVKPRVVRGERIVADIRAEYFYGAPVAGAQLYYTVFRSRYWTWWDEDEEAYGLDEDDERFSPYGEIVSDGELRTDANGYARLEIGSTGGTLPAGEGEEQFQIQVTATDETQRQAQATHTVRVSPGELSVELRPTRYLVAPGTEVAVEGRVRNLEGEPVAGVTVNIQAEGVAWRGDAVQREPQGTHSAVSDARGEFRGRLRLTRKGQARLRAVVRDRRGNSIQATEHIWVCDDEGGDLEGQYANLSVTPDKKRYSVGDTARILINVDRPGVTALFTIEGEDLFSHRTVTLRNRSTVVTLPISRGMEPNFYVGVAFVHQRELITSTEAVMVDPSEHRLQVDIQPDRQDYRPGDTATYRIRARDVHGRPVRADLSLGVVDEAIYSIREDSLKSAWNAFYPRRENFVGTDFSAHPIYLGDADKSAPEVKVRRDFRDTAFWEPNVRTDARGEAVVRVRLPDNLTSWRATVVAHTAETQIGKARQSIRVRKELVVRLQLPRFFVEKDTLRVTAVVHNHTASEQPVDVRLAAEGAAIQGDARRAARVAPEGTAQVEWEVTAGQPGRALFRVSALGEGHSDAVELPVTIRPAVRERLSFRTGVVTREPWSGELSRDAAASGGELEVRLSPTLAGAILGSLDYLATYPHGCTEQTMSSFMPNVALSHVVRRLGLSRSGLEARLPELTRAGLNRLYGYQHEDGGWGWWEYDESDPWMTGYVLLGLAEARRAGVRVERQVMAQAVGGAEKLALGRRDDTGEALERATSLDDIALLALSLVEAGEVRKALPLLVRLEKEQAAGKKLQIRSRGYEVLALAGAGQPAPSARACAQMDALWKAAETESGLVSWRESRTDMWDPVPQDVESTAVVLRAAFRVDAADKRLPGVIAWLMRQRRGDRWESTRDTAWVLLALTDYLEHTGELSPSYGYRVMLGGREVGRGRVNPGDVLAGERVLRLPLAELGDGALRIEKEGEGSLYFAALLRQEIRADLFQAESGVPGLSVAREYHHLRRDRDGSGRPFNRLEERPTTLLELGQTYRCRITLKTDREFEYLMVTAPLAAGTEVLTRGDVDRYEWHEWYSSRDVRDDRVHFYLRRLTKGTHTLDFYFRPELRGNPNVMPVVLEDMYLPALRAESASVHLEVRK